MLNKIVTLVVQNQLYRILFNNFLFQSILSVFNSGYKIIPYKYNFNKFYAPFWVVFDLRKLRKKQPLKENIKFKNLKNYYSTYSNATLSFYGNANDICEGYLTTLDTEFIQWFV